MFASVETADLSTREANRVQEVATVKEIHGVPDKDIPQELRDRAESVIDPKDIVMNGTVKAPAVTDAFMAVLRHGK